MGSVLVTIGRSSSGQPLPAGQWRSYIGATREAVTRAVRETWVDAGYRGQWDGDRENAHAWAGPPVDAAAVDQLRDTLGQLAREYGQDAIGLAFSATPELVEPAA